MLNLKYVIAPRSQLLRLDRNTAAQTLARRVARAMTLTPAR